MKSEHLPYEKWIRRSIFLWGEDANVRVRGDASPTRARDLLARETVEGFDRGDLVAHAKLVPLVCAGHDRAGPLDGV